jgi:hypothetical protein
MGKVRNAYESLKRRNYSEDVGVDGRKVSKWILKQIEYERVH